MKAFTNNVLKMIAGNGVAQLINVAALPIITRLYSPDQYGAFAIFLAFITLLYPISTLKYNYAIMLPKEKKDSFNLLVLSFISVTCFSVIIFVIMLIFKYLKFYPKEINENNYLIYLCFVPLGVLIMGFIQSMRLWIVNCKKFEIMALGSVIQSMMERGWQIFLSFLSLSGVIALIYGKIIGAFIAFLYLITVMYKHNLKEMWPFLSFIKMKQLAKRYREYNILGTISIMIKKISEDIPIFLLPIYFSTAVTGSYGLTLRAIRIPINIVGDAISKVFFQQITDSQIDKEEKKRNAISLFSLIIKITLPPTFLLIVLGRILFQTIFGQNWEQAGIFIEVLSISFFSMFLYRPFGVLFDAYEKQRQKMFFDTLSLVLRGSIIIILGIIKASPLLAVLMLSIITFSYQIIAILYLFTLMEIEMKNIVDIIIKNCGIMIPIIIGMVLFRLFQEKNYSLAIISFIIAFVLQGITIWYLEKGTRKITKKVFSNCKIFIK